MADSVRVVLVTIAATAAAAAEKIAVGLVDAHLAACVNVLPGAISFYWWEGKTQRENEFLLVIKTRSSIIPELTRFVRERHPAKVPEVIALPVLEGDKQYLDWVAAATNRSRPLT